MVAAIPLSAGAPGWWWLHLVKWLGFVRKNTGARLMHGISIEKGVEKV
jgi:hypothetical protein